MASQAPAQGTPSAPKGRPADLLNDATFVAIHDVLLLGWSLVELKSRIKVIACNLALDELKSNATVSGGTASFSNAVLNRLSVEVSKKLLPQPDIIVATLKNIILKDLLTDFVEGETVVYRDPGTPSLTPLTTTGQSLATELRDNTWQTGTLRAIFRRIVDLHTAQFPTNSTANTVYDISSPASTYPYLYPLISDQSGSTPAASDQSASDISITDYATIGVSSVIDKADFVTKFSLYEVTRRALNCLTMLLDTANESLVPDVVKSYQQELILKLSVQAQKVGYHWTVSATPDNDNIKAAIHVLSNVVIRLIEAWESFLLENLYVATSVATSTPGAQAIDNQTRLGAYQAGRSLASLSWNISVALVPLESTLTSGQQKDAKLAGTLKDKVQETWSNAFNDRDINTLQSQIIALGTAMDTIYTQHNPDAQAATTLASGDPDMPSQMLSSIKSSLDYWQRTIALLCNKSKPQLDPIPATTSGVSKQSTGPASSSNTAPASSPSTSPVAIDPDKQPTGLFAWLIEIFSANKNTKTPEPTQGVNLSNALNWDLSKTLRMEMIQQANVWQALITYQQALRSFTMETVTQRLLNDFIRDVEEAARKEFFSLKWVGRTLVVIAVVLLVIIVASIFYLVLQWQVVQDKGLGALFGGSLLGLGAIATATVPFARGITNRLGGMGALLNQAGTTVETYIQQGYQRVQQEFDHLNHNVAITYPLIEFFVWEEITYGNVSIEDGYDFLMNVFWTASDRKDELQRIVRFAFGPFGTFVASQIK